MHTLERIRNNQAKERTRIREITTFNNKNNLIQFENYKKIRIISVLVTGWCDDFYVRNRLNEPILYFILSQLYNEYQLLEKLDSKGRVTSCVTDMPREVTERLRSLRIDEAIRPHKNLNVVCNIKTWKNWFVLVICLTLKVLHLGLYFWRKNILKKSVVLRVCYHRYQSYFLSD